MEVLDFTETARVTKSSTSLLKAKICMFLTKGFEAFIQTWLNKIGKSRPEKQLVIKYMKIRNIEFPLGWLFRISWSESWSMNFSKFQGEGKYF